jgi:hypothetical protein
MMEMENAMQHDQHVWAWRTYRRYLFGLIAGMREIGLHGQTPSR